MKKLLFIATVVVAFVYGGPVVEAATEVYTVQKNDSLWKISVKYEVGLSEVIAANPGIKNPSLIYPGQKITVPLRSEKELALEQEVLRLANAERSKAGVGPLSLDWELSRVARLKSQDMVNKAYFSHQSPTYGSPFDMVKRFGITYRTAGENIATGQRSASEVMASWMNSPGHRKNILNPAFTHLGVGAAEGGSYGGKTWTQLFIGK
jgi:uncharacterized YkwD family protein/spore coat assembly protein SafA